MLTILVLGATGYIGGRLVPLLKERGHRVRCLVRDRKKAAGPGWEDVQLVEGDVLKPETLRGAFDEIDVVYYLVHSMTAGEKSFEERDRAAAQNVAQACARTGVARIVYLGGLGKRGESQSPHLRSRHEVGDILRSGSVPVTEFRAAVVVGSGSASFEMMHHLVNRLPLMICPRWVMIRTQPIAVADVLRYLVECVDRPETSGRVLDIGGPQMLTYRDMMLCTAKVLGLKRWVLPVPVLTPRLSSYWVNLVTPIPTSLARVLIESLRHETVCENRDADALFSFRPMAFEQAVRLAVEKVRTHEVETKWTSASPPTDAKPDPSHLQTDRRVVEVLAPADRLFREVASIGGDRGWYYADWLWKVRGFLDKQIGGVGLRRGRRHPTKLRAGDALDFWRVEEYEPGRRLLLRAEMKVWGAAWLEFAVEEVGADRSRLTQTATYYPRGLAGLLYWFGVYPLHAIVFRGLARSIAARAEAARDSAVQL